jgi:hypothetical protein
MFSKKNIAIFLLIVGGGFSLRAQSTAGNEAFAVLNLFNSAQMTSRGLSFMPRYTVDVPSALTNPSLISDSLNNKGTITYTDLFGSTFQAALSFAHTFNKVGTLGFGLQYINYGSFKQTEANGEVTGTFYANEYMFTIGWGTQVEKNIYLGATFKPLVSQYESYTSFTLAFDLAATYYDPNKSWQASMILKNIGRQVSSFNSVRDTLPTDLQLGFSKKFSHAPLTLYVVADNLTKWNIREDDPLNPRDKQSISGEVDEESKVAAFLDKGFRHLQFALDIQPSQYWYLSVGYSWRRHQEMKVDDAFSIAGISYGLGIKYRKFTLSYARNEYHNYGSPNYITLGYTF